MGNVNSNRANERANRRIKASERLEGKSANEKDGSDNGDANERPDRGSGARADENGSAGNIGRRIRGKPDGEGIGASRAGSAGSGAEKDASNSGAVKPSDLAGDTSLYQTDEAGNIIYKADGTPAKKRGRKPGQQNAPASPGTRPIAKNSDKNKLATSVDMLALQFQMLNMGIATITKFDDFAIDDAEATKLAVATTNLMEQFDYTPDPKIAATMALMAVASSIYGPRIYLYRSHLKKNKEKRIEVDTAKKDEKAVADFQFFN